MNKLGPRVYFPNRGIAVQPKGNFITSKGTVSFIVGVNQTKYEIKQYLKKLYGLEVIKVNTMVYQGKMKRDAVGRWYRTPAFKKAVVTVDNTYFLDQQLQQLEAKTEEQKE